MRRLVTPSWLGLHLLAVLMVVVCLRLGWWQWERATSPDGSARSLGYALQWPVFAIFVIFMWVKMVRDDLRTARTNGGDDSAQPVPELAAYPREGGYVDSIEEEDDELAAYNRYLAGLNARAHQHQ